MKMQDTRCARRRDGEVAECSPGREAVAAKGSLMVLR